MISCKFPQSVCFTEAQRPEPSSQFHKAISASVKILKQLLNLEFRKQKLKFGQFLSKDHVDESTTGPQSCLKTLVRQNIAHG